MKVLLSWLREMAPLDSPPDVLAATMSDLGMAVEAMEHVGQGLEGVSVARVLALRPHPGADRVQLVDVDGGGGDSRQVVCGAFNMVPGDLVPLAHVGAALPNGMEIARRKVRGEWSEGMLCAPDELGLAGGHDGILVLAGDHQPGTPLAEALGLGADVVFDLEINPNRPDAMSVAGVARDVAARLGVPFALPEPMVGESGEPTSALASVDVVDRDLCGRFVARVLRGVVVGSSPALIQARLSWAGMRPINSVVDVSNYVMLELGQPNHAYDLGRLAARGLRVRRAGPDETLVTLDGIERRCMADDLLICDAADAPVGIAGVLGGASAEVSHDTTELLLEVAWFEPIGIARTAKRLGLRTEASARFERGCDPEMVERAAARFCALLGETAPVVVAPEGIDERGEVPERRAIRVRTTRVNAVLGTDLTVDEMSRLLTPIGFLTQPAGDDDLDVTVPSWRPDSGTEIDVIEEVARHHGYSRILRAVPATARFGSLTPYQSARRLLRDILLGAGVDEALNSPFLAPDDLRRAGLDTVAVEVANPLAVEESVLRTSLLPGMLRTVAYNVSHRNTGLSFFEVGHVFAVPAAGEALPLEREHVGVALAAREAPAAVELWTLLVDGLALDEAVVENGPVAGLHPTRSARASVGGRPVGALGEVAPDVLAAFDITERVAWLELDLGALLGAPESVVGYRPISRFPSTDIDLAFVVEEGVAAAEVERAIRAAAGDLLTSIRLFDVYRGAELPPGARGLAYALRLQAPDRTLTDADVGEVRQRCIDAVESALPARLRA